MPSIRFLLCDAMLMSLTHGPWFIAQAQQTDSVVPTIRVTSCLVFLDVTVLDKQGRPVVSGLTKHAGASLVLDARGSCEGGTAPVAQPGGRS
jgi:hypothetical protein